MVKVPTPTVPLMPAATNKGRPQTPTYPEDPCGVDAASPFSDGSFFSAVALIEISGWAARAVVPFFSVFTLAAGSGVGYRLRLGRHRDGRNSTTLIALTAKPGLRNRNLIFVSIVH